MSRRVAAVITGFLFLYTGLMVVWVGLWCVNPDGLPGPGEPLPENAGTGLLPWLVGFAIPCGLLAGTVTALLSPSQHQVSRFALSLLVLVFLNATTFVAQGDFVPLWYQLSLPLVASLACWFGGLIPGRFGPRKAP